MKAELDEHGVLTVKPETPTESYALKKWAQEAWVPAEDVKRLESGHIRGSMIVIHHDIRSV